MKTLITVICALFLAIILLSTIPVMHPLVQSQSTASYAVIAFGHGPAVIGAGLIGLAVLAGLSAPRRTEGSCRQRRVCGSHGAE